MSDEEEQGNVVFKLPDLENAHFGDDIPLTVNFGKRIGQIVKIEETPEGLIATATLEISTEEYDAIFNPNPIKATVRSVWSDEMGYLFGPVGVQIPEVDKRLVREPERVAPEEEGEG